MAYYESCRAVTAVAGTEVTRYRFVAIASDGQADHVGTAQGVVDGICGESQATVGNDFPMIVPDGGMAKVEAATSLSVGDLVASNNAGKAIAWVDAAGNICIGKVVSDPPGADGEVTTIQFVHKQTGAGS